MVGDVVSLDIATRLDHPTAAAELRHAVADFARRTTADHELVDRLVSCVAEAVSAALQRSAGAELAVHTTCGGGERMLTVHMRAEGLQRPGRFASFREFVDLPALALDADDAEQRFAATIEVLRLIASAVEVHSTPRSTELRFVVAA
jgi:hypothetical protein